MSAHEGGEFLGRPPHAIVYTLLIVPFGAVSGYVGVAMAFLATQRGLSVEDGAKLVAVGMLPHVWKFFWAPVTDMTLTRKTWYVISAILCAAGIVGMAAIPMSKENMGTLVIVVFLASLASTFLGMSVEGLMAHATPAELRGRVGGWFQAGNLGGSGLGGGAGLWMATHVPSESAPLPWIAGAVLGTVFLAGCMLLVFVPDAAVKERPGSLRSAMVWVVLDFWRTVKSRVGFLCGLLCLLPIGTGAATSVLAQATVAASWGVGEEMVSLVNGMMNGLVSAVGCVVGGEICHRFNSRKVYAVVGLLMATVAAGMALGPRTPGAYVVFILAYAFTAGLAYAAFTGFVLDAIGTGAAATKYNAFASLSNTPITYMGLVLAWAFTRWGTEGMLFTEAGAAVIGVIVLGVAVSLTHALIKVRKPGTCGACGYDLAGLPIGAPCPQCDRSSPR